MDFLIDLGHKRSNLPYYSGNGLVVLNQPVVSLDKEKIFVTLRVKVVTLPLDISLELVLDFQQLSIVHIVNLIPSCDKEVVAIKKMASLPNYYLSSMLSSNQLLRQSTAESLFQD